MFSRLIYIAPLAALAERVAGLVGLIAFALIAYVVGKVVIRRIAIPKYPLPAAASARAETTRSLLLSVWKYLVVGLFMIAMITMLGVTRWSGVALTGSIGLIVAFGAQTLFKDVLAGFSVLLEGQYAVGDRVKLFGPDIEGIVEGIGLRITVIRENDGSRVFVPNGSVVAVRTIPPGVVRDASRRRTDGRGEGRSDRNPRSRPPRPQGGSGSQSATASTTSERPSESSESSESGGQSTGAPRRSRRGGRRRGGSRRPASGNQGTDREAPGSNGEPATRPESSESGRPDPQPRPPQQSRSAPQPGPAQTPASPSKPEAPPADRGESASSDGPDRAPGSESPWSIE